MTTINSPERPWDYGRLNKLALQVREAACLAISEKHAMQLDEAALLLQAMAESSATAAARMREHELRIRKAKAAKARRFARLARIEEAKQRRAARS